MPVKLRFLGAAGNVTGSRYLMETESARILVDCGLHQERNLQERDWAPFPIPPDTIDAVLLTHAHLDHCGYLPRLVKTGFRGPVFATAATCDVARIVLIDSAKIQEEDARAKRERHEREGRKPLRPVEPLYTAEDAERACSLFRPLRYDLRCDVTAGISAIFQDAGHILGSAAVRIEIAGPPSVSVLFSGDIGRSGIPILRDPAVFEQADYVLVESTYGDRIHEDTAGMDGKLAEIVNAAVRSGGNLVIPSFAVGRAQQILYYLNELLLADRIPHLQTFIDSPMAVEVTGVFRRHADNFDTEMTRLVERGESPFDMPTLKLVSSSGDSKAINRIRGTVVIIASSGMCTGGRIKHHLVRNISRPESTVLFVGYQAQGTLGREILDGVPEVRILGQFHPVRAHIARIEGFSGHADQNELSSWMSGLKRPPKHVFVTHGELSAAEALAARLRGETGGNVSVPRYYEEAVLG